MMLGLFYSVNLVLYLLIVAIWIAIPDELTLNVSATMFNVCLTMMLLILDRKRVSKYYQSNWFKEFRSVILSAILIFCILGLINYLSYKRPWHLDISKDKINSLTEQSIKVLEQVDEKLVFRVFERKEKISRIVAILDLYRFKNSNIDIIPIDVELEPGVIRSYNITKPGTVVVEYKNRREYVEQQSELAYSNAIIKLTRSHDPIVYYSVGHGELDIDDSSKDGGQFLNKQLQNSLYDLRKVNLATLAKIPKEVDVLMIWGPKSSFFKNELKVIEEFVAGGGQLFVAIDPNLNSDSLESFRSLISKWGIGVSNDLIVDSVHHISGSNGTVPLVREYNRKHQITSDLKEAAFFPLSSSVEIIQQNDRVKLLAYSSAYPASWVEKTPREILSGKIAFNDDKDQKGPAAFAAAWEAVVGSSKVVVFGNSTFVINSYSQFTNNFNLFFNALSWLTNSDLISSFNLAVGENRPIMISKIQLGVIFYFCVIFSPLALFGFALFWYRRRRVL